MLVVFGFQSQTMCGIFLIICPKVAFLMHQGDIF